MARKLFFAGLLLFISPDSPTQIVVAMVVALGFSTLSALLEPYISDTDDIVAVRAADLVSAALGVVWMSPNTPQVYATRAVLPLRRTLVVCLAVLLVLEDDSGLSLEDESGLSLVCIARGRCWRSSRCSCCSSARSCCACASRRIRTTAPTVSETHSSLSRCCRP